MLELWEILILLLFGKLEIGHKVDDSRVDGIAIAALVLGAIVENIPYVDLIGFSLDMASFYVF